MMAFAGDGCHVKAASTPWNAPSRTMNVFPDPPSSPGQPKNLTVPAKLFSSKYAFVAQAPPNDLVTSTLCPHPCPLAPSHGCHVVWRASLLNPVKPQNSPNHPIPGSSFPSVARNPVAIFVTLHPTVTPLSSHCVAKYIDAA